MSQVASKILVALVTVAALSMTACSSAQPEAAKEFPDLGHSTAIPADADPDIAAVYKDYVMEQMPGVPYALVAGAAKEGTLLWYSRRIPAANDPIVEAFQKAFPFIQVTQYSDSGPALFQRFMTEQRAGTKMADVVQMTGNNLMAQAIDEGYIADYTPSSADLYPTDGLEPSAYPFGESTRVVYIYNTDLVSPAQAQALDEWDGPWSGAFDGLPMAVVDPSSASLGQDYWYAMEQMYGDDAMAGWAALDPQIAGSTPTVDAVSRGSAAVGFTSEGVAAEVFASGAPVRWTVPNPAIVGEGPQAIVKSAPHPYAARLFQEFVLSEAGQDIYSNLALFASKRAGFVADPQLIADQSWWKPFADREPFDGDQDAQEAAADATVKKFEAAFKK